MARIRASDLEPAAAVLASLRSLDALTERGLGRFTLGSRSFLHFHALASGLVADVKVGDAWRRYEVADAAGRRTLIRDVPRVLAGERTGLGGRPT
jgi:hypothetical protein